MPSPPPDPLPVSQRSTLTKGAVSVVKNIPEVNALLWRVKHVIRVDPVTFPDGAPSKDDLDGWQLLEVSVELAPMDPLQKRRRL